MNNVDCLLLFVVHSPTLFIGEEGSVIYALPSLVDENTVRVMVILFYFAE